MQAPVVVNEGEIDETSSVRAAARTLGNLLLVIIILAADDLNPVKVLCSYTNGIVSPWQVACLAALLLFGLVAHERERFFYHILRLFFRCTFNNMFFRSVEIVGLEHLPKEGPVILTGNHNNQFVDGVILLTNCHREISFMIAEKSYKRPFVGFLARAFHCIPVSRPQDIAVKGEGTVSSDATTVLRGDGTRFTAQVQVGGQVEIAEVGKLLKVKEVVSDVELTLEAEVPQTLTGCKYKIFPKVDQSAMYETVYRGLKKGKCLGIFPEGGSHDRTDLMPLKAGVAIIGLDAFSKHGLMVPIVPVGLNYFHGHRFGGRVVVEFGAPIDIPESLHAMYETDRRAASEALLGIVATGMRSVIVPVPDYHTLQQVYMVRRLYVPDGLKLSPEKAMDLNRRFAVGTFRILQLALRHGQKAEAGSEPASPTNKDSGEAEPELKEPLHPEDVRCIEQLRGELEDYMSALKRLGLRDHQVRQIGWWSVADLVGRLTYLLITMALGVIPQMMFNLPVMLIASKLAVGEQQKSLKASSVKLAARDVVMSYKIIYVLSLVPVLYLIYGSLICYYSSWTNTTIILVLVTLPAFAFLGMKASEQGFRAYTDLVPLFKRLLPGPRKEQDALPAKRAALQRRLHSTVKIMGPKLGDLYWQKEVDWSKEMSSLEASSSWGELLATTDKGGDRPA